MTDLDRVLETPPCPHCGQPLPLPPHVCDALAVALSIGLRRLLDPATSDETAENYGGTD